MTKLEVHFATCAFSERATGLAGPEMLTSTNIYESWVTIQTLPAPTGPRAMS